MARTPYITCSSCAVSMHNYAYEYHEHNSRRKPSPKDSVSCNACRGTGLIQGGQAHFLGGRVLRCTRCGGHGLVRATSTPRPSPRGGVSILKPQHQANPPGLTPSERESLIKILAEVVTDAEKETEKERVARLRERIEEQEHHAPGERPTLASGMNTETVEQVSGEWARLWDDVGKRAERRGRVERLSRRILLAGGLISIGAFAALLITQTALEDLVDSVGDFWSGSGIAIPVGGPEQSDTNGAGSAAPAVVSSPTATATPTPTPVPVSPWVGFIITSETLGKDITDRLSEEEVVCLRSSNSGDYYEYFQSEPIGVRVSMNPPVRDVTDLPKLAECLSEESAQHLNLAIAVFHDPSLATPIPKPTPRPSATPKPPPTERPTPRPTNTPTPTPMPELTRADQLRQLALDLINKDRADHGMPAVALGTNHAAQLHAQDMLTNDYQGHWWADGRKPYMVYTQTGGTSYVAENVASSGWLNDEWSQAGCGTFLVRCIVPTPEEAIRDLQWLMMYDDAHADWGHRDNILRTSHRFVNIGIAWASRRVTFVQHFEGGTVAADAPPSLADGRFLSLSITKNEAGIRIGGLVSVYYDPPPTPVSRELNDSLDSYCIGGGATTTCGSSVLRILDPPGPGYYYSDLDDNDVVASSWSETATSFSFTADVGDLMEKPGVYTVMLWRDDGSGYYSESLVGLSVFVD